MAGTAPLYNFFQLGLIFIDVPDITSAVFSSLGCLMWDFIMMPKGHTHCQYDHVNLRVTLQIGLPSSGSLTCSNL